MNMHNKIPMRREKTTPIAIECIMEGMLPALTTGWI